MIRNFYPKISMSCPIDCFPTSLSYEIHFDDCERAFYIIMQWRVCVYIYNDSC